MNVLVTGARGCLGQLVVASLRERRNTTLWTSSRACSIEPGYIECDLSDASAVDKLVDVTRPDVIFHLAGSFSGNYATDLAVNAESARYILEGARRRGLKPRTVLIGSAAEYGQVELAENPISEQRALRPVSVYGATKAFQTMLASLYAHRFGMEVVVARLFNLLAADASDSLFVGRVQRQIAQVKQGQRAFIELGSLSSERDYISGADAVEHLLLIASKGKAGEVYNVGSGKPTRMHDVLAGMLEEAGLEMSIVREHPTTAGSGTRYDAPVIYADMAKTRRLAKQGNSMRVWP